MSQDIQENEGRFRGREDLNIFWRSWIARGGAAAVRATIVIAHGMGEHSGRYRRLAVYLVGQGCAVYVVDHRGHGRSEGRRAYVDSLAHAATDLDQLVDLARADRPSTPLFLLGHSMGGSIAIIYAHEHQSKIDGLILSAPFAAIEGASNAALLQLRLTAKLAPAFGVIAVDPSQISSDPAEISAYASDPDNFHGKAPARTIWELVRFVQAMPGMLPGLRLPLLVMHGKSDKLVPVSGSVRVVGSAGSADKALKVYDDLRHEIFNELPAARARVFDDLGAWIHAHAQAGAQ